MPYDWIDPHRGNIPQINREDAGMSDEEKALAEERSRALHVPGVKPGKLMSEPDAMRGVEPSDPRGLVFDHDTGALRPVSDDDYEKPAKGRSAAEKDHDKLLATEKEQDTMEAAATERREAAKK